MARTGVGYIDIARAADALKQRGEEPTVDRVRAELGTGSKSTIAPLLKRWRSETGDAPAETGGLPKELVDALKALYEQVQGQAQQEIQQAREECETAVGNLERELAAVRGALSERTQALEDVEQKLQISSEEGEALQYHLDQTRAALEKSEFQREDGLKRITELKSSVNELKQENRDVRQHFEHFQQRTAEDRQQERDQARLAAEQLRSQIASLNAQLTRANNRLTEGEAQIEKERSQVRELESERQRWIELDMASKAGIRELEGRQSELRQQLNGKTSELETVAEKLSLAQVSNASAAREAELHRTAAGKLEAEVKYLQDKLESARDENRQILQEKAVLLGKFAQLERSLSADEVK